MFAIGGRYHVRYPASFPAGGSCRPRALFLPYTRTLGKDQAGPKETSAAELQSRDVEFWCRRPLFVESLAENGLWVPYIASATFLRALVGPGWREKDASGPGAEQVAKALPLDLLHEVVRWVQLMRLVSHHRCQSCLFMGRSAPVLGAVPRPATLVTRCDRRRVPRAVCAGSHPGCHQHFKQRHVKNKTIRDQWLSEKLWQRCDNAIIPPRPPKELGALQTLSTSIATLSTETRTNKAATLIQPYSDQPLLPASYHDCQL